ncbi:lysosomal alpha-mannosidase-like [Ornithodoros turicata]|uniref:lysosomal alpha-mannosidase-like n=1 Tax=Ornithodoros turicata TaxID=34597 RepID=UPI0031397FDA
MIVRLLLSACAALSIVASGSANQCEEKGCPDTKQRNVNVHVIPHSHNDAGWLESVDEVYAKHVKDIYGSSIDSLVTNNKRRYVSCENVFFSRWWKERSQKEQDDLRALLSSGRLQFVGGGWVQNDEAVTHYTAIIDQMTLGLRFLNDTFGDCGRPTVAWQADPFGHSRCQANLFAQMGFDGLMIGRVSNDDVARRQAEKEMLFVWKTEPGNSKYPIDEYYV